MSKDSIKALIEQLCKERSSPKDIMKEAIIYFEIELEGN